MQTKTARESIHENVVAEPDLQVRCFSYEDAGVRVPAHWHHSLEILLIDTGSMEVNMNDTRLQLQMGDFVLINSGDIHSTSCSEHARICVLQIPGIRPYPFPDRLLRKGRNGPDLPAPSPPASGMRRPEFPPAKTAAAGAAPRPVSAFQKSII